MTTMLRLILLLASFQTYAANDVCPALLSKSSVAWLVRHSKLLEQTDALEQLESLQKKIGVPSKQSKRDLGPFIITSRKSASSIELKHAQTTLQDLKHRIEQKRVITAVYDASAEDASMFQAAIELHSEYFEELQSESKLIRTSIGLLSYALAGASAIIAMVNQGALEFIASFAFAAMGTAFQYGNMLVPQLEKANVRNELREFGTLVDRTLVAKQPLDDEWYHLSLRLDLHHRESNHPERTKYQSIFINAFLLDGQSSLPIFIDYEQQYSR